MNIFYLFIAGTAASLVLIPFFSIRIKGIITLAAVTFITAVSAYPAVLSLMGSNTEFLFAGSIVTGEIPLRIDALSGFFILVINFTFLTGAFYGFQYLKAYLSRVDPVIYSLHCISFILALSSLIAICSIQNGFVFLIAWEIMALSAFILVMFEHYRKETIRAGINYIVQSHICVLFIMTGFIWVAVKMNSFSFDAVRNFSASSPGIINLGLFFCFFIGFSIKAGFVPFHTWLPHAHPAAPSHISGIMSGVIIKIGIYGIMRMLLLIQLDYLTAGYIILIISVMSGLYGVMLAIIQHNLKRLLAYHSIENIGIIGMGIGLGCIGLGTGNRMLAFLGFSGALLHVLNHSLFKSLLFYAAGNVYQAAGTMNIEKLGGLIKRMPGTAFMFLIAALAICGLPPFNGFISEFLIYSAMFGGLSSAGLPFLLILVFSILGLVIIGGLAIICFTKAFGTVFLGIPRAALEREPVEMGIGRLIPMGAVMLPIVAIGIFPDIIIQVLSEPVNLFFGGSGFNFRSHEFPLLGIMKSVARCSLGFYLLAGSLFLIRRMIMKRRIVSAGPTWGCGYAATGGKLQYTASSFIRNYRKLAEPLLSIEIRKKGVTGIFPKIVSQESHPYDKIEGIFIDRFLNLIGRVTDIFSFLQNGNLQYYILYGLVFIMLVMTGPVLYDIMISFLGFIDRL